MNFQNDFILYNSYQIQPKTYMTFQIKKILIRKDYDEKFANMVLQNEDIEEEALQLLQNTLEDERLLRDFKSIIISSSKKRKKI